MVYFWEQHTCKACKGRVSILLFFATFILPQGTGVYLCTIDRGSSFYKLHENRPTVRFIKLCILVGRILRADDFCSILLEQLSTSTMTWQPSSVPAFSQIKPANLECFRAKCIGNIGVCIYCVLKLHGDIKKHNWMFTV